jgi:spore germination protein YaaH/flagellar hook assembly protein FlgD
VPSSHRPDPGARRRLVPAAVLGLTVLGSLLPWTAVAAAEPDQGPRILPTIHHEDAVAHAKDRIDFEPGGRVTVPFRPRPGDRWVVDGHAPRALPAGRLTGRELRRADGAAETRPTPARPATEATDPPSTPATTPAEPTADPGASPSPAAGPAAPATEVPPADTPSIEPEARVTATLASWTSGPEAVQADLAAVVDPGGLKREVFGFLPYWELTDSSTRLDWGKISTLAYFGVGTDSKGNLLKRSSDGSVTVGWKGWTSAKMTNVIDAAHRSGARVVLTVQSFAWSSAGLKRQKALLGSSTARARLASQIAAAVRDRGADGVNLDFEPLATGYADEFTALVRKIRSTLNATARGYQLTFDTTGWIGNYPIEDATAPGGADAIMVMGYDYRSSGASRAGSVAPLRASSYDITETVDAYLARVPASKVILGVPYYGRAWSTKSDALHATNVSGGKYGASTTAVYTTARELAAEHGRRYDTGEAVAWTAYKRRTCTTTYGCVSHWRQLYYDDARALKAKYDLVNRRGLRGVGIWALGYDGTRTELYQALADKFIKDTVPPTISGSALSTSIISPNGDGRLDSATASLTATAFVRWGYRLQKLDGTTAGPSLRSGTVNNKTPRWAWNGKDADGKVVRDGRYRIALWVEDLPGNRTAKTFVVTVDTRKPAIKTSANGNAVSPDDDGHADTTRLAFTSSQAITGSARILDADKAAVRIWSLTGLASWSTTWTGRNDAGTFLPDGRYIYRVDGRDRAGNRTVVDRAILIDRTLKLHAWSRSSFDPRAGERTRMTVSLRRSARVTARIYLGSTVIRRIWTDKSLAAGSYGWTWNGRTGSGAMAKPGRYKVVVSATSRFGTTRWTRYVTVETH